MEDDVVMRGPDSPGDVSMQEPPSDASVESATSSSEESSSAETTSDSDFAYQHERDPDWIDEDEPYKGPAPGVTVNPDELEDNCYYCTVAAVAGVDVKTLVARTGIMQESEGEKDDAIQHLSKQAGVWFGDYTNHNNFNEMLQTMRHSMAPSFGISYDRQDGDGHMVNAKVVRGVQVPVIKIHDTQYNAEDDSEKQGELWQDLEDAEFWYLHYFSTEY